MSIASTVKDKLSIINSHLTTLSASSTSSTSSSTTMTARPPITCHVLDTTIGLPAQNIPVSLSIKSGSTNISLQGQTNTDGRVTAWSGNDDIFTFFDKAQGRLLCILTFETEEYWQAKGIAPFFSKVDINFTTIGYQDADQKSHWHVPLLLGPYNYTTYRGS